MINHAAISTRAADGPQGHIAEPTRLESGLRWWRGEGLEPRPQDYDTCTGL